jgi:hypothetical protein
VIATIALLVALAGTGYAATSLPRNSVGNAQLQSNAVTSSKVKNGSLERIDFGKNQIPKGPRGPVGAPGPPGAPGARGPTGPAGPSGTAATKWAFVGKDGNLIAGTPGVVVVQSSPGKYYVNFGSPVNGHAIVTTPGLRDADPGTRGSVLAGVCGNTSTTPTPTPIDTIACLNNNNTNTVFVITSNSTNSIAESHAFYVAVL